MEKQVDLINNKDKVIGQAGIDYVHKKLLLHRAVHIFIINSEGKLFCRQRSFKKKIYPGYWSTSVGKHVLSDHTYKQTANEALKNTLGITCKLNKIGKIKIQDNIENEITMLFVGYSSKKMKFNPDQIEDGKFLTINKIEELSKQEKITPHLIELLKLLLQRSLNQSNKHRRRSKRP